MPLHQDFTLPSKYLCRSRTYRTSRVSCLKSSRSADNRSRYQQQKGASSQSQSHQLLSIMARHPKSRCRSCTLHAFKGCSHPRSTPQKIVGNTAQFSTINAPGLSTILQSQKDPSTTQDHSLQLATAPTLSRPQPLLERSPFTCWQDPTHTDRQHPVHYTDPLYANSFYTAHASVSGLFAPSLDAGMVVDSGTVTEYIQGCI